MSALSLFPAVQSPSGEDVAWTPVRLAEAIVDALLAVGWLSPSSLVWEPSCGGGAFLTALSARGVPWQASTIEPCDVEVLRERYPSARLAVADARAGLPRGFDRPSVVLGNPPFSDAIEHVTAARSVCDRVAFLLPVGFGCRTGGPADAHKYAAVWRAEWSVWPTSRVGFGGPGRDAVGAGKSDAAVYVWGNPPPPCRVIRC